MAVGTGLRTVRKPDLKNSSPDPPGTGTLPGFQSRLLRQAAGQSGTEPITAAPAPAAQSRSEPVLAAAPASASPQAGSFQSRTLRQAAGQAEPAPPAQTGPQQRLRELEQQQIELTAGLDLDGAARLEPEIAALRWQLELTLPQQFGKMALGMAQAVPAGLEGTLGSMSNAATMLYQLGQEGRQARDRETLEEYRSELEMARQRVEQSLATNDPWEIQAQQNLLQTAQARYDAMSRVLDGNIQQQATAAAYELSDQIAADSAQRMQQAKQGVLRPGQVMIDATASAVQTVADGLLGRALDIPGSMIPFAARAFGGATQQARQDGADLQGQLLYGGLSTAKEIFTEKLFNLTLPFSAAYGAGSADAMVEQAIRRAVDRFAQTQTGRRVLGGGLTLLAGAAGEGLEEFIGDWLEWQLPRVYGAEPDTAGQTLENALYDFLVGSAAGAMGGVITPEVRRYGMEQTQDGGAEAVRQDGGRGTGNAGAHSSPLHTRPGAETALRTSGAQLQDRADALWRAAESLGRTGAETLSRFYDGESDTAEYFGGFAAWYQAGLTGLAPEKVRSPWAQAVNQPTRQAAYLAGQADARSSLDQQRRQAGQARTAARSGLVYDEYVRQALPQETAVRLDEISRALGVSVRFVDQVAGGAANAQIRGSQVLVERSNANPVAFLLGHEWTHRVQELAPDAYREFRQAAAEDAGFQADIADIQAAYDSQGRTIRQEALLDEAAANYAGRLMENGALMDEFIARHRDSRTLLEKLRDAIRGMIRRLTGAEKRRARTAEDKLSAALDAAAERARALEAGDEQGAQTRYLLNESFGQELDAWLENTPQSDRMVSHGYFLVGTTSQALRSIGVRDGSIFWRKQKIGYILAEHPEMDARTLKKVPELIEHPAAVLKSLTREDSIVLLGDVTAANGNQVMAALELTPRRGGDMNAEFTLLSSAYSRTDGSIQNLLKRSEILYLDKERADTWLMQLRVQFPSGQPVYGSMGSISYEGGKVNIEGKKIAFETSSRKTKGPAGPAGGGGQSSPAGLAGDSSFAKGAVPSADGTGETRYSLKAFEDGTRFVDVETDQQLFDGLSETEMRHLAARIIKSKFAGRVIGTDHPVFVNGRTASEYVHPTKNFESDLKKVKMRASTELDNLIDAGTNFRTEPDGRDGHTHPDMTGDFQYFDTIFKVGGEYYTGVINIMPTKRGLLLKDITKIRNITQDICSSYGPSPKSAFLRDASMGSVAQSGGEVKTQQSLKGSEVTREMDALRQESADAYAGKDLSQDSDVYTYDFLTALPDMTVTALPDVDAVRGGDGRVDTRAVVELGMENARAVGTQRDGKVFVRNSYTGRELRVDLASVRHGLNGGLSRLLTNARLGAVIGDVVKNAVPINALQNKAPGVTGTYAMAGYATDSAGREFVVIITVEQRTGSISGMEAYDVTHAVSGRQKKSSQASTKLQGVYPIKAAAISIADFLESVKSTHQSILPLDVLNHFGEERNPEGDYTGQAKFSLKGSEVTREMDALRQESLQLQAWVEKRVGTPWSRDSWTLPDAERMARRLGRDLDSRADVKKLGRELWELGETITGKAGSWEAVLDRAMDIAGELVDKAVIVNDEMYRQYADLRGYLRKTKLHVPRSLWADLEHLGGYNELRKRYFGRLNLSSTQGTGIDQAYQALAEQFPEFFDEQRTVSPADQLEELTEVLDSLVPVYENPFGADRTAARSHTAYAVLAELSQWNKVGQAQENARRSIQRARSSLQAREEQVRQRLRQVQQRQRARRMDSQARQRLLNIARRLKNRKLPAATRALVEQYIGELDTAAVSITGRTVRDLRALELWYQDRMANDPDFIADPHIERMLQRLGRKQIAQLSAGEVAELTDVLLGIERQTATRNKLIADQDRRDVYHMMDETVRNIEGSGGDRNAKGLGRLWSQAIVSNTLSPIRMLRRMTGYVDSDPLVRLGRALADGQRTALDYEMRAGEPFRAFARDGKFRRWFSGKNAEKVTVRGWSGTDATQSVQAEITPAMRVSLYLHSLNPQNLAHIVQGGVTIPDSGWYARGDMAEAYARGVTLKLTPTAIRQITSKMTPRERAFAQAARRYFNETSRTAINAVSEQLKGYSIAGVNEYFPIHTDSNFSRAEFESIQFDGTIEGMGFLKERKPQASSPILLRDASDVLDQAIRMHGKYVGLAIPVRNMSKLLSATEKGYAGSVMKSIGQMWGKEGGAWLEKLMADLQGTRRGRGGTLSRAMGRLKSSYAGAVLELNASVAMKQAASYPTAAAVLGWKPLARALKDLGRVEPETIGKYTPLLWYRSLGFEQAELRDMGSSKGPGPKLLNWIQGVDVLTTRKLWKASEYYVREHSPELARGSEAYYQAAAEIYNRVIEETQPNYTPMQRPQLLRSDDTLLSALSMFKTQPFQNFGILYDAAANLLAKARQARAGGDRAALGQAWRDFGRAVSSQLVQLGVFAGMTFAWALFRGRTKKYEDEDAELSLLSVLAGLGTDMAGGVFSMIPFGTDAWELGSSMASGERYYGMDAVNVSAISDAADAVIGLYSLGEETLRRVLQGQPPDPNRLRLQLADSAGDIGKLFGVPAENVLNLTAATARQVLRRTMGNYLGEYYALRLTTDPETKSGSYYDLLYQAMLHSPEQYEAIYRAMADSGDFPAEKIKTAMETRKKKAQGVTSVDELDSRYLAPEQQRHYDQVLSGLEDSALWSRASGGQRELARGLAYELSAGSASGASHQERIDGGGAYGLTETDYVLFRLALSMADQPNESGNLGTYTNEEVQQAIEMLTGLSDAARSYLWSILGKSGKSDPWG